MYLRRLKDVIKKVISFEMFLRGLWDVSLNGNLIENSQRYFMPARALTHFDVHFRVHKYVQGKRVVYILFYLKFEARYGI